MKAVFLDFATVASDDLDLTPLKRQIPELELFDHTVPDDVIDRVRDAEYVFVNKVRITREVLTAAPGIKFIGLVATGVDNVDLETAAEQEIAVCNIRAYCTQSVVEHIFAVMLAWSRSLGHYTTAVRNGRWQQVENFCFLDFPIRELSGMTIGIVGHGVLGSAVADMARNFDMHVLIAERREASEATDQGRTPFSQVLARSDVISLHCPLTVETRNLIGASELELMPSDALLINTARGALIESGALINALEKKQIGAAAIDVLTHEPPVEEEPLLNYSGDKLILTPHIAWASDSARQNAINELAANVQAYLGGRTRNRVDSQ